VKLPKLHQTTRLNHTVRARVAAPRCGELPDPTDPAEGRNAPAAVAPYLMANIASPPPSSPPPHLPRHSRTRHALAALLGSTGAWRSSESLSFFASGSTKRPLPEKSHATSDDITSPRRRRRRREFMGGWEGAVPGHYAMPTYEHPQAALRHLHPTSRCFTCMQYIHAYTKHVYNTPTPTHPRTHKHT